MGLNASRRNDLPLYSSDRLAQMVGSGQLALVDRATGYSSLFSPEEMGFFASLDELAALVRRMIAEPVARQAAAAAGRARYHALFNETRVARYVQGVAFGSHDPADYEWPTLID
ncbi:MAG: glycosyltransferase [Rhodospirillales bacterium]